MISLDPGGYFQIVFYHGILSQSASKRFIAFVIFDIVMFDKNEEKMTRLEPRPIYDKNLG